MSKKDTSVHMYNDLFLRLDPNTMRTYKNLLHAPKSSTKTYSWDKVEESRLMESKTAATSKASFHKSQKALPFSKGQGKARVGKPENKIKSYAKFVEMRIQSTYPCARQERRFKWQMINGMPMDPEQHPEIGIKRVYKQNEFDANRPAKKIQNYYRKYQGRNRSNGIVLCERLKEDGWFIFIQDGNCQKNR